MTPRLVLVALLFIVAIPTGRSVAQGEIQQAEYAARRSRLVALLDSTSVVVLKAVEPRVRSNDVLYPYRQESNIYYLCGQEDPGTFLLLSGRPITIDGTRAHVLLFKPGIVSSAFIQKTDSSGDALLLSASQFPATLNIAVGNAKTVYLSAPDAKFINDWLNERPLFLERDSRKLFEEHHPGLKVKNASPFIARLREIKSPAEIAMIRKAIAATGAGLNRVMVACKPGLMEYELQADVEYEMLRHGARAIGFPSIVGSGPNSLIPHYDANTRRLMPGDLVVLDVGAEYQYYSADITRTLPVSGKYTPEQRAVYLAVLKAQRETIQIIRAGLPWKEIDKKARESIGGSGYGRYTLHGVTHHLGLDTHDAGSFDTLRAGMVITVEPGIYIPANDTALAPGFRGFGIRIEDDVLVTSSGCTVLSTDIPKDPDQIERVMNHEPKR